MNRIISAFVVGLLFALGLGLAGMTLPEKVVGFLDVTGNWDPSLVFVLASAVGTYALLFRLVLRRKRPVFEPVFSVPSRRDLTPSLVIGSSVFGAGWGLVGFCPAPAMTSIAGGNLKALVFVLAMFAGMVAFQRFETYRQRSAPPAPTLPPEASPSAS